MNSEYTLNPNGGVLFRRLTEELASSHHFCQRTVGEDSLPGYGPVILMKRRGWGRKTPGYPIIFPIILFPFYFTMRSLKK